MDTSNAAQDRPSTTSALWQDGTTVYFDDLVYEGQIVAVFRTEREAQKVEGWATDRRVVRGPDGEWLLEERGLEARAVEHGFMHEPTREERLEAALRDAATVIGRMAYGASRAGCSPELDRVIATLREIDGDA